MKKELLLFAAILINVNTASLAELDKLIGVGPAIAQRIIDARPYASLDELLKVSGIGPKTLQKIKDQGLAYVAATAPVAAPVLPKIEKSDTTVSVVAKNTPNPWLLFLSVLGAALAMASIMLILKFKIFKIHNTQY